MAECPRDIVNTIASIEPCIQHRHPRFAFWHKGAVQINYSFIHIYLLPPSLKTVCYTTIIRASIIKLNKVSSPRHYHLPKKICRNSARSEERRVGKECRS